MTGWAILIGLVVVAAILGVIRDERRCEFCDQAEGECDSRCPYRELGGLFTD